MDIFYNLLLVFGIYLVFKLGETYAYYKIARGIQNLKDTVNLDENKLFSASSTECIMVVEKINGLYYAYHGDKFVGQASNLEEIKTLAQTFIDKNPGRFTEIKVRVKEAND